MQPESKPQGNVGGSAGAKQIPPGTEKDKPGIGEVEDVEEVEEEETGDRIEDDDESELEGEENEDPSEPPDGVEQTDRK